MIVQNNLPIKQLLIGLPGAGKTTFLAALWHLVESSEIDGTLLIQKVDGDREYLNSIRSGWVGCQHLERTKPANEQIVSMRLMDPLTHQTTEVYFPDLSGETFKNQWENRQWSKSYRALVRESAGSLLFIHPDQVKEPTRIDEADMIMGEIDNGERIADNHPIEDQSISAYQSGNENTNEGVKWEPSFAPTQVILVELLQYIALHADITKPFKIAVIISAWDLVESLGLSPKTFLRNRLPLLHQYLIANSSEFPFNIYGLSAQGGTFDERHRLMEYEPPSERIIVIGDDCGEHDISAPVAWVMSG